MSYAEVVELADTAGYSAQGIGSTDLKIFRGITCTCIVQVYAFCTSLKSYGVKVQLVKAGWPIALTWPGMSSATL